MMKRWIGDEEGCFDRSRVVIVVDCCLRKSQGRVD